MSTKPTNVASTEAFNAPIAGATRTILPNGYVRLYLPDVGLEYEHRLVLAQKLGRPLRRGETAHHIDGDRSNNDPTNIELWVGGRHQGSRAEDLTCPHCGERYA